MGLLTALAVAIRRAAAKCTIAMAASGLILAGTAGAEPDAGADDMPQLLPVMVSTSSNWEPQFPFPFDHLRQYVTDADINAERDMCQWFNAQYYELKHQIERLNNAIIRQNGDFQAPEVQQRLGIVTTNVDQSLAFLAPRALALTQSYDDAGDMYFPIYQGDAFYGLWQQLSNVNNGLRAHQPTWFTGPSFLNAQRMGSKINRSHVCR